MKKNRTLMIKGFAGSIPLLAALLVVACLASGRLQPDQPGKTKRGPAFGETVAGRSVTTLPTTGGDHGGSRYSPLRAIHRGNVRELEVVWTYHHGDVEPKKFPNFELRASSFEGSPLLVERQLIYTTPFNRVISLDPETGRERWTFDPRIDKKRRFANMLINRGAAYRASGPDESGPGGRIYLGTLDGRLIALDSQTGEPDIGFGTDGQINLLDGIEGLVDPWEYNITSPATVIGDVVVVGSSIADMVRRIQPSGHVRAFDARTGELRWRFNTIPRGDEFGSETWENESWKIHGGANVWSTMVADLERNMIFLPVSTAGPDFYGGDRPGDNLFSDSVVALDASTGERIWHFQTVHHDLWDYDLAAPPVLVTVNHDGRPVDAVVQLTKGGMVFVLDRETGEPLFEVEERPVPQGGVPGEVLSPTQPFPVKPEPLSLHALTEDDLWDRDPKHRERCEVKLRSLRNEGIYTPPTEEGSLNIPGSVGGSNWSGAAFDPETGWLYAPVNDFLMTIEMKKLPDSNFEKTDGKVMASAVGGVRYLTTQRGTGLRYQMIRKPFQVDGVPCLRPPWGQMVAVNLNSGEIEWRQTTGEDEDGVQGLTNFGPPLVTAGGLLFHGGTVDQKLYAYDSENGEVLASFDLPAGLHAGPATYEVDGRQFLVVAPGGHASLGSKQGDAIIAYALPE
jgi:quinoprotein glucose dehydrogenase